MKYLIIFHLLINTTLLYFYLSNKQEKIVTLWKEVLVTLLVGWLLIFILDE